MRKSLVPILSSLLALVPLKSQDSQKDTLVLYESPKIGKHQEKLLEEVRKLYGERADYAELSPHFPREVVSKDTQNELIGKNGIPKQILVLADYNSFTPESVVVANRWIRNLDEDPFPDAKIAFFPSHPKYTKELTELVFRKPYPTESALTRFDDQVISFANSGLNVNHRKPIIEIKKDGRITEKGTENQSRDYIDEANSGNADYIARFGHSGSGFWQSTDLMDSFWLVGIDKETLVINPGTSVLKTKKVKERFTGELDLEELIKRDKIKKYPRISSVNPKIVDNYAACNSINPPHKFNGREFSTVISNMVGNNAYVWGYGQEVAFIPQAGAHQLLFWGSNGANSFTDSLLGSTIWVTSEIERLEREKNTGLDYQILKSDELGGMFFGLPDNLTHAKTSSRMYDQKVSQKRKDQIIETQIEVDLRSPTERNDYRMKMWSPPVIILPNNIDPLKIQNANLEVDGHSYRLQLSTKQGYSTAQMPNSEGEITFIDNAVVLAIAPVYVNKKQKYKEIERDKKIKLSFDSN